MSTAYMRYVICPKCGDAVAGKLPSGDEPRKLKCIHCSETFSFTDSDVKGGLVSHDENSNRWTVAKIR